MKKNKTYFNVEDKNYYDGEAPNYAKNRKEKENHLHQKRIVNALRSKNIKDLIDEDDFEDFE